jgi:solute carrier family 25 carnitine/acylcarnitine transporter 20/29
MKTAEMVAKSQTSEKRNIELPSFKEFIAGSVGGVGQVLSAHPLDTIKVRLQVQAAAPLHSPLGFGNAAFKGPIDCLVRTVQHEGFLGLYKGMVAPLAGVAFINAVLFSTYGWAKNILSDSHSSNHLSLGRIAIGEIGVF